ncbi:MAG: MMPL family transporter, partial [Arenicellales bacterium]|nr:MMPL family transporter [Arenicellales bacterium]
MDASADSLLLDDDQDLKAYRELSDRYGSKNFLVVAIVPDAPLFNRVTLDQMQSLASELTEIPGVESVNSILDVPLLLQSGGSLTELAGNFRTLRDPDVDFDRARMELINSPVFSELVVSVDGMTTALQLNLVDNSDFEQVKDLKRRLSLKMSQDSISEEQQLRLDEVSVEYQRLKDEVNRLNHETIASIRQVIDKYRSMGNLMLGGVSMIADDMISFIRNDLIKFGAGVMIFLIAMLAVIFRSVRWVVLPLASCAYAGMIMIGLLGMAGWQVTVISSNFISLMLILTMSMNVHLVVRYRQLAAENPAWSYQETLWVTMRKMVWPCFYTALTTVLAFGSLVLSSIKPVIDFGWMMSIGLLVTFLVSFLFFPTAAAVLQKPAVTTTRESPGTWVTRWLSHLSAKHGRSVISVSLLLGIFGAVGISKLQVENSFINYFGKGTEIYQGLKLIDRELGGTTPLEVLIRFDSEPSINTAQDDQDDELDLLLGSVSQGDPVDYWFTPQKIETVSAVHDFLQRQYGVGQVLSLASLIRVGESISQQTFDAFELAVLYKRMPADLKAALLTPYVSIERNEVRLSARVKDSLPNLKRNDLLKEIQAGLEKELDLKSQNFQISGLVVLYNNMLQSLFESQIKSLGVVMLGIAVMLLVLFRSIKLALIGVVPNILAALIILG